MLSNSLKRLNQTGRLITVDDISDSVLAGRSPAHTACWKYLQVASYDSALEHAEQIIDREPQKPDGYVFKARALFKKGRFLDAEETLIRVMRIVEEDDLLRSDVEGMIKLKDELANSRVEILRMRNFREPIDIAEMHWNDCHKPILELIGFATHSRNESRNDSRNDSRTDSRRGADKTQTTPMDVDIEIIDIIGAERAKQLYPELMINTSPKYKSTPNLSKRSVSFTNLDMSSEFPTREQMRDKDSRIPDKSFDQRLNSSSRSDDVSDLKLQSAGLKTALLLAEEKNGKYERKIADLEQELRKVYQHLLKLNGEKRVLNKKCDTLSAQLDKVVGKGSKSDQQSDNDIQIIRHYVNTDKKRRLLARNPHIPPWKSSILPRPFKGITKAKVNLSVASVSRPQKSMVFTNSGRSTGRILEERSYNNNNNNKSTERFTSPAALAFQREYALMNSSVTNASRRSYPPQPQPSQTMRAFYHNNRYTPMFRN